MSAIFEGHRPRWPEPTVSEDIFVDKESMRNAQSFLEQAIKEANKKQRRK